MFDADQTLDCTGLSCPLPMLKLGKAVKKMDSGKTVYMIATDPGSKKDVPDWIERDGHELVKFEEADGKYHYLVRKK